MVLGTVAVGVVFGITARRYHRLAPGMIGHACFNLLPVLAVLASR